MSVVRDRYSQTVGYLSIFGPGLLKKQLVLDLNLSQQRLCWLLLLFVILDLDVLYLNQIWYESLKFVVLVVKADLRVSCMIRQLTFKYDFVLKDFHQSSFLDQYGLALNLYLINMAANQVDLGLSDLWFIRGCATSILLVTIIVALILTHRGVTLNFARAHGLCAMPLA